jgi:hypothetical protein
MLGEGKCEHPLNAVVVVVAVVVAVVETAEIEASAVPSDY